MAERPSTPLPMEPPFQQIFDRIEAMHADNKVFRDRQTQTNATYAERILELELLDKQKQASLNSGNKNFSKLEQQIEKVNAKIDWPWYKTIGAITPAVLLILTWVWYAAQVPSQDKFEALKDEVYELKLQQGALAGKLENIQASQADLSKKLDDALRRP